MCALEHFGLGRYGDAFDIEADRKAINEMIRVLKKGGHLIITTGINKIEPSVVFNAHRTYTREILHNYFKELKLVEETYFSRSKGSYCEFQDLTEDPGEWDVYMGCWEKY